MTLLIPTTFTNLYHSYLVSKLIPYKITSVAFITQSSTEVSQRATENISV